MAKIIHTILYNDDFSGSRSISMDNCPCSVFIILRGDDNFMKNYADSLKTPALYVLMNKKTRKAYVGETDNFYQRLQQHIKLKEFWDEAYAFTASDGSLTQTEVLYLEAVAYEQVKNANVYDLSENSQIPQKPHMQNLQRFKAEEFFKYVQALAMFSGCDVFCKKTKSQFAPATKSTPKKQEGTEGAATDTSLDGRVKLTLNGEGPYLKNHFVHAVIKEYIKTHPSVTIKDLKQRFPTSLLGKHWSRWELIEDNLERAQAERTKGNVRHLLQERYVLRSGDNVPFVVCSQWDKNNLPEILRIVEEEGWKYEIV